MLNVVIIYTMVKNVFWLIVKKKKTIIIIYMSYIVRSNSLYLIQNEMLFTQQ